ncbi:MAG: hypothetical protein H0U66_15735 [Gemmatimonadaceae bacterium]|nr:hypothetical protein [Gemmatimonadaceae bacterium]
MRTRAGCSSVIVAVLVIASATFSQRAAAQEADASAPAPRSAADSAHWRSETPSVFNAHRVTRVINEGSHVVLADGSIWEVYLPDRPAVNTWRPGDVLMVRESSVSQGEYDYTLKDGRTRGAVYARLVGDSN